jgi:acyl-CoA thioesterase FadM
MSKVFGVDLRVRGYEATHDRTVGLPQVLSYMEHCRWEWILDPSLGLAEGLHTGHFFVVHRQTVALARTFGIGTRARVRAALRKVGRVQCDVEQDVVRDDGVLLARAHITAIWLGPSGRMVRLPDAVREGVTDEPLASTVADDAPGRPDSFLSPPERTLPVQLPRLVEREVPDSAATRARLARPSDCDMFGHVNGSNYLRAFEDVWGRHATQADIEYRGQATADDLLQVRSWPHPSGRAAFALQRGDETLCRAVLAGP